MNKLKEIIENIKGKMKEKKFQKSLENLKKNSNTKENKTMVKKKKKSKVLTLVLINVNLVLFASSIAFYGFASNILLKDARVAMMDGIEMATHDRLQDDRDELLKLRDELSGTEYAVTSTEREVERVKLLGDISSALNSYDALLELDRQDEMKIREEFEYALNPEHDWSFTIDGILELRDIAKEHNLSPHKVIENIKKDKIGNVELKQLVKTTIDEMLKPKPVYASRNSVPRSNGGTTSSNVTSLSGLSAVQLEGLLHGGLSGLGQAFYDMEQKHGVNAIFAISVAQHESGHGNSGLARSNNNLFGVKAGSSGWRSFSSKYDSVMHFGSLMNTKTYIGGGRTSVDTIGPIYCEGNAWAGFIKGMMRGNIARV